MAAATLLLVPVAMVVRRGERPSPGERPRIGEGDKDDDDDDEEDAPRYAK